MADTETETTPVVTQEPTNSTEGKVEEENNNSGEVSSAAENSEFVDPVPSEVQPVTDQDANNSQEPEVDSSIQKTEGAEEEAAQAGTDAKEAGDSSEAPPQETVQVEEAPKENKEDEPVVNDESEKVQGDTDEPKGEDAVVEESTEKKVAVEADETPKQENEVLEKSSTEKVEDKAIEEGNDLVEADVTPKDDEEPGDAEAPIEVEASPETGDTIVEKASGEMELEGAAAEAESQEKSAENSNSNGEAEGVNVVPGGETNEHEQPRTETAEVTEVSQNQETPERDQTVVDEPPVDAEKDLAPAYEELPTETVDDAQLSTPGPEVEPAEEKQELTDYEIMYRAAQKDIAELKALNVEIQERLTYTENEAKERKRQQASADGKDGMKVHADYLSRELSQQQDTEKYLREKLAEVLEEKEESERKCKDLQLRLKRFVKDDQAKDERMAKMESELREITREVQLLEEHLDEGTLAKIRASQGVRTTNGEATTTRTHVKKTETPVPQSKTCTIL